jgi:hypothetical protein
VVLFLASARGDRNVPRLAGIEPPARDRHRMTPCSTTLSL